MTRSVDVEVLRDLIDQAGPLAERGDTVSITIEAEGIFKCAIELADGDAIEWTADERGMRLWIAETIEDR